MKFVALVIFAVLMSAAHAGEIPMTSTSLETNLAQGLVGLGLRVKETKCVSARKRISCFVNVGGFATVKTTAASLYGLLDEIVMHFEGSSFYSAMAAAAILVEPINKITRPQAILFLSDLIQRKDLGGSPFRDAGPLRFSLKKDDAGGWDFRIGPPD